MDITLIRSTVQRKNPRLVIFKIEGRQGSVQFFRPLFSKDGVPESLTLTGEFAPAKVKETPEERKARLKARPKLTAAEKLAKMEKQIAKMKAKLAAAPPTSDVTPDCVLTPAPEAPGRGEPNSSAKEELIIAAPSRGKKKDFSEKSFSKKGRK